MRIAHFKHKPKKRAVDSVGSLRAREQPATLSFLNLKVNPKETLKVAGQSVREK
jgi:hypothetical protein